MTGRVVDLKKPELKTDKNKKEKKTKIAEGMAVILILLSWFWRRKKRCPVLKTNFLKNYEKWQKREEFIENEFFKELPEDFDWNKNLIGKIANLTEGVFFLGRFAFVLTKKFLLLFSRKKEKKVLVSMESDKKNKIALIVKNKNYSKKIAPGGGKKEVFSWKKIFKILFFFGLPFILFRLFKNIFFHSAGSDYFFNEAILKETNHGKLKPLKRAVAFLVLLAAILLPFRAAGYLRFFKIDEVRARVFSASEQALSNLRSAAGAASDFDLGAAEEKFSFAKKNFSSMKGELSDINGLLFSLAKYAPNKEIRLASYGQEIASAGESASAAGENLSRAGDVFISTIKEGKPFSEALDFFIGYEKKAKENIDSMNSYLEGVDSKILPSEYQQDFNLLKEKGRDLSGILSETIDLLEKVNIFLGAESDKRYLLVFENNREMRASGGFIGSYALIDLSRGRLKNVEIPEGGSYDTEGGLLKRVISPEPLWLVNPLWHFWDANWWPDWKISAKKLSWFYEKSGGPSVDGVIAFTPTVLEEVLEILGPIDMTEECGLLINSQNLWESLRAIIEKEKNEETDVSYEIAEKKPKKIIGELFSAIISELPSRLDKNKTVDLLLSVVKSFEGKQILLYFNDGKLQAEAEENNFAGRIKNTDKDYLMVVNTNIAGGKSDGKIKEEITHSAEIMPDGSVVDTLTIKRQHQGEVDELFYGVRNVNWMRIYVPLGSQLLSASGFRGPDPVYFSFPEDGWEKDFEVAYEEGDNALIDKANLNTKVYEESDKTVFANWSMIDPGQEATIVLKYKLPFRLEKKLETAEKKNFWDWALEKVGQKKENKNFFIYSLLAQKQPGSLFTYLESNLMLSPEFSVSWRYPEVQNQGANRLFSGDLEADIYSAVILEKIEDPL